MRNLNPVLAGALIAGVSLIGAARAAPVGLPDGARAAIDQLNILEAAHMWSGQDYCWYEDGWNGAGGISAAMRGVRIMVGAVRMAGMDGLPRCGDIAWVWRVT
jgi:hypothetical protein